MGTNYYARKKISFPITYQVNNAEELEKHYLEMMLLMKEQGLHLGKTSSGCEYLASWNGGKWWKDSVEYLTFVRRDDVEVFDEYGTLWDKEKFIEKIMNWRGRLHPDAFKVDSGFQFMDGEWF